VGVLLGLGDSQLREAVVCENRADSRLGFGRRERDRKVERLVVLGHRHQFDRRSVDLEPLGLPIVRVDSGEEPCHLPGAVCTEVEEDRRVTVFDSGEVAVVPRASHDRRFDELVGVVTVVGLLDSFDRRVGSVVGRPVHNCVVGSLRPLPVLVSVHRVVAARDGRHVASAVFPGDRFEVGEELTSRFRCSISSVGEGVCDGLDATLGRTLDQCVEVCLCRVDAAVADETEKVDTSVVLVGGLEGVVDCIDVAELSGVDGVVDPRERLIHRPARADVDVADFTVAHLTVREADRPAVSRECSEGTLASDPVERRCVCRPDGISSVVIAETPAVENDQRRAHIRTVSGRAFRSVDPATVPFQCRYRRLRSYSGS
jgi:hypothetical protein